VNYVQALRRTVISAHISSSVYDSSRAVCEVFMHALKPNSITSEVIVFVCASVIKPMFGHCIICRAGSRATQ